jgi:hypothetical protein
MCDDGIFENRAGRAGFEAAGKSGNNEVMQ